MDTKSAEPTSDSPSLLSGLASVWYVLLVTGLLMGGVVVWRVTQWGARGAPDIELDLSTCLVPRNTLVQGARPGAIPRMTRINTLTPEEADKTKIRRGKFLVKGDLVIGVAIGGEAMAYPLRFLQWHEAIDHELAGVPILISYGPLDGGVGVFDRRPMSSTAAATSGGAPLSFIPSGYVSNSAQLLFDDKEPPNLWSPILAKAVSGPPAKAGARLKRIPAEVLRWEDWRALHPKTRVLAHDDTRLKLYGRAPYKAYLGSDSLKFPVEPLPPAGMSRKSAVLAARVGEVWKVYSVDALVAASEAGRTSVSHGERTLRFQAWRNGEKPAAARFLDPVDETVRAYWFAWYAARPNAREVVDP